MVDLDEIKDGLTRGEFFLEYLPITSLKSDRCVGAEALLRWRRGDTIVPPLAYIPDVENTSLSGLVTYWVIDTVANELGAWLRTHPDAQISINVPPELLGRGGVMYAAKKSGLTDVADQIILEITERGVPDKMGVDALNRAVGHGVKIALDGVGADDPNLVVLARAHVDIVKLNKSYVDRMLTTPGSRSLARFSALLQGTPFSVIAAGVETRRQAEVLAKAGIDMAQGWLYSHPLGVNRFMTYWGAHQA